MKGGVVVGHVLLVLNFCLHLFDCSENTHHCRRRDYFPVIAMDLAPHTDYSPTAAAAAAAAAGIAVEVAIGVVGIAVDCTVDVVDTVAALDTLVEGFDIDSAERVVAAAAAAASWRDESVGAVAVAVNGDDAVAAAAAA